MENKNKFPPTRYQGSKFKLLKNIKPILEDIKFNSALDAFSGTASVSYLMKDMGKRVYSNDILKFNSITSKALIENNKYLVKEDTINFVFKNNDSSYLNVISENFEDVYFNSEENIWLDRIIQNIFNIENKYEQAICFWALFQSCITKRPYGLFHRKNLHIRNAEVNRSFGNKKTWDTSFEVHFLKFISQANSSIFNNKQDNISFNKNIFNLKEDNFELVYLDPPYIPEKGSFTYYGDFYHFLEGISNYYDWFENIDGSKKHKPFSIEKNPFENKDANKDMIFKLLEKFKNKTILFSYRSDGIPTIEEIIDKLTGSHKKIDIYNIDHQYVLSKKNMQEVLIKATPYL